MRGIRDDDRAFTPMAGTGLLVGVVVLLLAVVGAAVFGFIDAVEPPEAEFDVSEDDDGIVIVYLQGDPIAAEELVVRGDDPDGEVQFGGWPADGVVEPGDRVVIEEATGNEEVRIVWESAAFTSSEELAEYDGEEEGRPDWADDDGFDTDPLS
ncbi:type IV pilin [Halorubrum gandharaense]